VFVFAKCSAVHCLDLDQTYRIFVDVCKIFVCASSMKLISSCGIETHDEKMVCNTL
jgi:hypothetical protein